MGLFKEIYCAECGKKAGLLTRTKLADGNYLCFDCADKVPDYMLNSLREYYSIENYRYLMKYLADSNESLRPIFQETFAFYNIHIDLENYLFYIGKSINEKTVFLRFRYVNDYKLTFTAEEIKEGTFGDKITGKLLFRIQMDEPAFYHETILNCNVKVKAKKAFFGTEYRYENPKGMDDFLLLFQSAIVADLEAYRDSLLNDDSDYTYENAGADSSEFNFELHQAMSLFMIDDLSTVTLDSLKAQRNRLIKTFHPDATSDSNTKYAQKINSAYEILKKYIEQ